MIRNTYYHLDVEGESGRKMRETPLFSTLTENEASNPAESGKQDGANPPPAADDEIIFNLSLRGA